MDIHEKLHYFANMLDRFHNGEILSTKDIVNFLKQFHDFYLETVSKPNPHLLDLIKEYEQQLQPSS